MGKYMRKCRAAAGDSSKVPAVPLLGVRTRSRVAAVVGGAAGVAKRRKQSLTMTTARAAKEALSGGSGAGCYLHLRSRKLFMASAAVAPPRGLPGAEEASSAAATLADSGASRDAAVAGISRYSSTASSAARERNSGGEAEVCESRDAVESSVSDSGCGDRERRETTPSSQSPANLSDLESSQASHEGDEQKRQRTRSPAIRTTTGAATTFQFEARAAKMPPAAEIEEFFAAAEKAEAERFAAKYNFDVALGVPLSAGRFEWTPVASV